MTAIAGIWNLDGRPAAGAACERMLAAQRLYGPHHSAVQGEHDIALGRCMFELLPEDRADRGPLAGADGRYLLVADVRLDNREELAAALGIGGDVARGLPDATFLLRAWERWQDRLFERLYGDYAFALWDARERRLFLARDHFGSRPLHYHLSPRFAAFASMPKGLHALPEVPYAPDAVRAADFLALLPEAGPRSFFEGVSRVEAGEMVVLSQAQVRTVRHWRPQPNRDAPMRFEDAVEGLRAELDRAVAVRLRGAGERVGCHLSAGLDSSAITATAARLLADSGGNVVAFTSAPRSGYVGYVPADRLGDEAELAAEVAALNRNVEHVVLRSNHESILDDFDRDFFLFERPLVNPDIQHWWNQINAEARSRGLKVLLTGLMGNTTMSYNGAPLLGELARTGRWGEFLRVGQMAVRRGERWRGVLARAFSRRLPVQLWHVLARARGRKPIALSTYSAISQQRFAALGVARRASKLQHDFAYRPWDDALAARLWTLRRIDFGNNQKGVLGGWGVDLRDPTTDRRLIEFCLAIPTEHYVKDGVERALARDAFADRLPAGLLAEARRGLQSVDWHEGLETDRDRLRAEIARLEHVPEAAAALDLPRLHRLIEQWPTANWNDPSVEYDYRFALIRGVASGHFLRRASRSNA